MSLLDPEAGTLPAEGPDDYQGRRAGHEAPTCPRCGHSRRAGRVDHPLGRFLCPCGSLFNGDRDEWERLRGLREEARGIAEAQAARLAATGFALE